MLSLGCRDTGAGVLGRDYVVERETEEEVLEKRDRASNKRDTAIMKLEDITPQFKHYYRQYIKHH